MNAVLLFATSLFLLGTSCFGGPCGCSGEKKELPTRIDNECEITYYKRIFPIDMSCGCKEKLKTFYENVFYKYEGETEEKYITRIDIIFEQIYQKFDCRTDSSYVDYLDQYYTCKYGKKKGENDEVFFNRVLEKSSECASDYRNKIELMKRFVRSVDWSKVIIEENTSKGYSIIKKTSSNKRKGEKKKGEDCERAVEIQQNHYKNEDKVQSQQLQHTKNVKNIEDRQKVHDNNVKTIEVKKREHEENVEEIDAKEKEHEQNVERIEANKRQHEANVEQIDVKKKEHEINVEKIEDKNKEHEVNVKKIEAKKIEHEENVRKWIKANYKRKSCCESIENYYNRICSKDSISDEEYVNRLTIARSVFSNLDLWYSEKYLSKIKCYYELAFSRKTSESDDEYFDRLLRKEDYESEENFFNRIRLFQLMFPSLSLWYDERFYETYTFKFYQYYYKKGDNEVDGDYLKRVFTKLSGESEQQFWMRVKLIKKTFPNYPCWYIKENIKNINACKSLHAAETVQDLKNGIDSENISEECRETKTECLTTFFESSYSSCSCGEDITVKTNTIS